MMTHARPCEHPSVTFGAPAAPSAGDARARRAGRIPSGPKADAPRCSVSLRFQALAAPARASSRASWRRGCVQHSAHERQRADRRDRPMMNRSPVKPSRARLPALLIAACLGALHAASGCGRADSPRLDSETHWLTSCGSDQDCVAGRCECGVCTETCVTSADCAGLGVAGVECAPLSGACAPAASGTGVSSEGGACLLSCFHPEPRPRLPRDRWAMPVLALDRPQRRGHGGNARARRRREL
jgi:hypothetical protein